MLNRTRDGPGQGSGFGPLALPASRSRNFKHSYFVGLRAALGLGLVAALGAGTGSVPVLAGFSL